MKLLIKPVGYDMVVTPSEITFTEDLQETTFRVEVLPNATLKTHYINYEIAGTNKAAYKMLYDFSVIVVQKVEKV